MTKLSECASILASRVRYLALMLFLVVLSSIAPSQTASRSQDRPDGTHTIKVNTNLVVLHATAHDHKGAPVSGLDKDSFQVYEDGALQQIKDFSREDLPVTVGLVIDNSGSMREKRAEVIAAALAFARSSNPQDQMFVVNFNEHVRFALPDNTPFTDKVPDLEAALSRIRTRGETALYDAVAAALEHLKKGNRDKKVLIVISDGGDNASKYDLAQVMAMAQHSEAIVYTIGLFDEEDRDRNTHVLKELAGDTGGDYFQPDSLKEAVPVCERIARDIRNQYTITYVPANARQDGTYRLIQVKADGPGHKHLSVRTRAGYRAPLAPQPSPAARANVP
ncbi:MAG TPA: VWA domain-containing protein [Verrucomicrobiae bacterium]|jgi:Ca-activated chloride channel family protein|nr:VWA domain-containing protein [Verrucomicrobiae bacterium]